MYLLAFADIVLIPDGTIFIHIAMILGMIWILNRTLFRPVNRVLEARERNKGGSFSEAADIMQRVGEKESKYTTETTASLEKGREEVKKQTADAHVSIAAEAEKIADSIAATILKA